MTGRSLLRQHNCNKFKQGLVTPAVVPIGRVIVVGTVEGRRSTLVRFPGTMVDTMPGGTT